MFGKWTALAKSPAPIIASRIFPWEAEGRTFISMMDASESCGAGGKRNNAIRGFWEEVKDAYAASASSTEKTGPKRRATFTLFSESSLRYSAMLRFSVQRT